jgi:hypothetical protein
MTMPPPNEKKHKTKEAIEQLRVTPTQARNAGTGAVVGSSLGSLTGTTLGATIGATSALVTRGKANRALRVLEQAGKSGSELSRAKKLVRSAPKVGNRATTGAFLGGGTGGALGGGAGASIGIYSARPKKPRDGDGDGIVNEDKLKKRYELRAPNGQFARSGMTEVPGSTSIAKALPRDGDGDGRLNEDQKRAVATSVAAASGLGSLADVAAIKSGYRETKETKLRRVRPKIGSWKAGPKLTREVSRAAYIAGKGSFGIQIGGLAAGTGAAALLAYQNRKKDKSDVNKNAAVEELFAKARVDRSDAEMLGATAAAGGAGALAHNARVAGQGARQAQRKASGHKVGEKTYRDFANAASRQARRELSTPGGKHRGYGTADQAKADFATARGHRKAAANLSAHGAERFAAARKSKVAAAGLTVGAVALGAKAIHDRKVNKSMSEVDEIFAKARGEVTKFERETRAGTRTGASIGSGVGAVSGALGGARVAGGKGAVLGAVGGAVNGAVGGGLSGALVGAGVGRQRRGKKGAYAPGKPKGIKELNQKRS